MKPDDLVGQWVWVDAGMPFLFIADGVRTSSVRHYHFVRIERVEPATATTPAIAIWSDAEGTYGVDAEKVRNNVASLAPSGSSPVRRAVDAIARRFDPSRKG